MEVKSFHFREEKKNDEISFPKKTMKKKNSYIFKLFDVYIKN